MKKANLFIYTLIVTILSIVSVNAKMMNVDEIGKEVEAKASGARYVYIIGKYAYTSTYENFTLQDVMLAASDSINIDGSKDVQSQVGSMTIYRIDRTYEGYTAKGWKLGSNEIGNGTDLSDSKKIDVRYIDYKLLENESTAKISVDLDDENHSKYKSTLETALGFKPSENYGREGNKLTIENDKVKGLLLRNKEKITLSPEDKTKYSGKDYYLAYIIEVPNATDDTKVTVKTPNITEGKEVDHDSFDVKINEAGDDKTPGVVMLVPLSPESAKTGKIEVTIDLDGDDKGEYGPTTYTLDLSELEFQEDSKIQEIGLGKDKATEADKKTLEGWGYNAESNKGLSIAKEGDNNLTYKLTGKLVEQKLSDSVFGANNADAYYFDFTLVLGNNQDKKATIKATIDGKSDSKTFQKEEYDENGNLTILQRIAKNTTCGNQEGNNKCIIKLEIDLDGEEDKYLPQTYTLDYSGLTFEKSSLFTVTGMTQDKANIFTEAGWYNEEDGYEVKVEKDEHEPNKYNISGLLPILDENDWQKGEENDLPFDSQGSTYYYLGLGLKLVNPPEKFNKDEDEKNISVVFDHDALKDKFKDLVEDDFQTSPIIYILKALKTTKENGDPLTDDEKYFTITVDLDGESEEYAPYTVTIDYSELKFQFSSTSGSDYAPVSESEIDNDDKEELEEYGFDFDLDNITYKTEQDDDYGSRRKGLTGTVKEQTLEEQAGFGDNSGYYVPVKITVPEEILEDYKDKWTIYLKDGSGSYVEKKRAENHYEDGYIVVLFKMKDRSQGIHYKIDYDGSEGKDFILSDEIKIETEFTYQSENKITFEYFDETTGTVKSKEEKVYESETIDEAIAPTLDKYTYHTFDYWYKTGHNSESFEFGTAKTGKDEDITLKAHWTIDVDKFMEDVIADLADPNSDISSNFSTHFEVTKNESTITFNVINSSTKLSEMDNTSIPGTIAYLLNRGEIKEITLKLGDKQVVFTKDGSEFTPQPIATIANLPEETENLKNKIQKGAQALYSEVLTPEQLEDMTLVNLAHGTNPSFTLSVGNLDETVKLADEDKKVYTFMFESDLYDVEDEKSLKQALESESKTISITKAFNVSEPVEITRDVLINGENKTLTSTISENKSIFNIKDGNVTIENVTLAGANPTAITVESGEATIKNTTITGDNLAAGIEVKSGAKLNVENLTYEKEHYNKPAVKADKDNVIVNLTNKEDQKATPIEKETITEKDNGNDTKTLDTEYNSSYRNYYNDPKNSIIYKTELYNYQAGSRLTYIKYNYYNEKVKIPTDGRFTKFTYDGEDYNLIGFTEKSYNVLTDQENVSEGDIAKDDLKATKKDGHYWAVYKLTLKEGIKKVTSSEGFIDTLKDDNIHEIYFDTEEKLEIDLTKEDNEELKEKGIIKDGALTINRDLSIIGKSKVNVTIKAKKIEISENVEKALFNRVNLDIVAREGQDSLIEVKGSKLSLWQSNIKSSGETVDYAVKYSNNNKAIVDIRFMGRGSNGNGFEGKINKAYIYVSGKLAAGSDLFSNEFDSVENIKTSTIIIDGFADDATIKPEEDNEPDIRFENNSVKTPYAIVFTKNTSGQKADIKLGNSQIKIGIEYADNQKNFEGIGLFANQSNVELVYLTDSGSGEYQEQEQKPDSIKEPKFKAVFEMLS